jgi:hypothetical protein
VTIMKLEDARAAYETLSSKASDIVRQMSLAGVGVIWIFKSAAGTAISLERPLLKAALFIFLALLFDLLQYVFGAITWFVYFRHKEGKGTEEDAEFLAPPELNWPTWALFYLKTAMMLIAYVCYILPFLATKFEA